jgi:hypothetical protein
MKTLHNNQHDYITVTVVSAEGIRLNLTQARWSAKVTLNAGRTPNVEATDNFKALSAEFKKKDGVFGLFMKGPQMTNPGVWALACKAAGEESATMTELITKLREKLTACDVPKAVAA